MISLQVKIPGIGGIMVFCMLIIMACIKDDFELGKLVEPNLELDGAAPLIHSKLQLNRILPENSILIQDPATGLITLVYEKEIVSLVAEDYLKIPDQEKSFTRDTLNIAVSPGIDIGFSFEQLISLDPPESGQRIDSISIKSGMISLDFLSGINHNASIVIDLPTVKHNGIPFHAELQHTYDGNIPVTGYIQLDLSGYDIQMITDTSGAQKFPLHVAMTIFGDNNPNLSPYGITFTARLTNLKFSRIFGYFGNYSYNLADSLELSIFRNNFSGSIHFEDLKLSLTTLNSIGMPMQLNINEIKAFSTKNPPYVVDLIDNPAFPNPIVFYSPEITQVGQTAKTVTVFTTNNCNLNQALDISPTFLHFDFTGKSNPADNPAEENFLLDTSRFTVLVKVELPFSGSITDFALTDTVSFNFTDIDRVEEFSFVMVTLNRFPLNVELQVRLTDDQYQLIDSLIYDQNYTLLQSAPVGGPPLYRIIDEPPVPSFLYRPPPLTRARIERLKNCKKMIIFGRLNSTNSQLVKIYNDYSLDVRIGARATFNYP